MCVLSFVFGDLDHPMAGWYATWIGSQEKLQLAWRDLVPSRGGPFLESTTAMALMVLGGFRRFLIVCRF
jgi:hypothetical protein